MSGRRKAFVCWLFLLVVSASQAFLGSLSRSASLQDGQKRLESIENTKPVYRIRQSREADLSEVASMLSEAVVHKGSAGANNGWPWKAKLDRIFAKADIETLLRQRLLAIQIAQKHYRNLVSPSIPHEDDRIQLLWMNTRLRDQIEKASSQTGEENLWQEHNFAITPPKEFLQHLQLTAEDIRSGQVLGFVEVAQLSDPRGDKSKKDPKQPSFSPAITNLATSADFRRKGIATRLLRSAETFAIRKWGAKSLGLYVERRNFAALALYQNFGFEIVAECPGGDTLDEMYYMSKSLVGGKDGARSPTGNQQAQVSV